MAGERVRRTVSRSSECAEAGIGKGARYNEKQNVLDLVEKNPDLVISRISAWIYGKFDVSDEVIETRARRESIWPPELTTHRQSD